MMQSGRRMDGGGYNIVVGGNRSQEDGRMAGARVWTPSSTIYDIQGMVVNAQNSVAVAAAIGRLRHIPFVPPYPLTIPSLRPVALPQPCPSLVINVYSVILSLSSPSWDCAPAARWRPICDPLAFFMYEIDTDVSVDVGVGATARAVQLSAW